MGFGGLGFGAQGLGFRFRGFGFTLQGLKDVRFRVDLSIVIWLRVGGLGMGSEFRDFVLERRCRHIRTVTLIISAQAYDIGVQLFDLCRRMNIPARVMRQPHFCKLEALVTG